MTVATNDDSNAKSNQATFLKVGQNLYRNESSSTYYGLTKRGGKQFRTALRMEDARSNSRLPPLSILARRGCACPAVERPQRGAGSLAHASLSAPRTLARGGSPPPAALLRRARGGSYAADSIS